MMRMSKAMVVSTLAACGLAGTAVADGIFEDSYAESMSFSGNAGLEQTSMNMTYDGSSFWASSGGGSTGIRLAQFANDGTLLDTYEAGLDFRSVFTAGGNGATVYGRAFSDATIYRQTSPGVFVADTTLIGGTLNTQSQVVFNSDATEYIAHEGGQVDRWDLGGNHLGSVALSGYGSMFGEGNYPANRGMVAAGGYYLTYSQGMLSAWDDSGNRVGTTELLGAGTSFDSEFSLSWAANKIWIIDEANGTWRGYNIPAIPAPGALALLGIAGLASARRRR